MIADSHWSLTWNGTVVSVREPLIDDLISNGPILDSSEACRPVFSDAPSVLGDFNSISSWQRSGNGTSLRDFCKRLLQRCKESSLNFLYTSQAASTFFGSGPDGAFLMRRIFSRRCRYSESWVAAMKLSGEGTPLFDRANSRSGKTGELGILSECCGCH